jgi:hypothetical protein
MAHKAVAQIIFNKNNEGHVQYPDPKKSYEDLKYLAECIQLIGEEETDTQGAPDQAYWHAEAGIHEEEQNSE